MASSAATTLSLGIGFAVSTHVVGGASAHLAVGAVVGYMVAAAVGAAVPGPAGLGATDAGLVGVLLAGNLSFGHAVSAGGCIPCDHLLAPAGAGLIAAGVFATALGDLSHSPPNRSRCSGGMSGLSPLTLSCCTAHVFPSGSLTRTTCHRHARRRP